MNRSRKKPMRTYGRKKTKVRYMKTNVSIHYTEYNIKNVFVFSSDKLSPKLSSNNVNNPTKDTSNLLDLYNSSAERKFDLLLGKKPGNIFSSSNSSLSTFGEPSGLSKACSSALSLVSVHENLPSTSLCQTDLENKLAIDSCKDEWNSSTQFKFTKHICLRVTSRARKLRISKRFSFGGIQQNSTPIQKSKRESESPIEEWGLSPIVGNVKDDSANSSNSPDIFEESNSDGESQSQNDNNRLPRVHLRRKRSSLKRYSVMRSRKRKSSFQQAVEISDIDEDVPNHSITSCQADSTRSYPKDPALEETAIIPADNVSRNSISSLKTEGDDEQPNGQQGIPLSELSQRLSNLEIDRPDESCVIQVHDSQIDKNCSTSSNKSTLHSKTSLVESMRMSVACSSFSSQIDNGDEIEEEDELKDEPPNALNSSSSSHENISNCRRSIGEGKEDSKIEKICVRKISSDESDKETESEDDSNTVTSQDFLDFSTKNVEAVNNDLKGDKEEEDDHDNDEEDSEDDRSKDYCYKDLAEKEFKGKINPTNVLDADSSLSMTGFELDNDRTFDFIPGKKYRRSLAAFRQSKSSTGLGSLSRVGCNRHSIIRPSAKLKEYTRMTLITTTIEEDLDETLDVINVDEDKDAAKNKVLSLCDQTDILKFESVFYESTSTDTRKIGEGVYGEVFMMSDPRKKEESIVVKIIPVEGNLDYNGEVQKRFHEIISEIYISQALSNLKKENIDEARFWTDVYCNIIASNCFRGKYPKFLVDLWNEYDEKKVSENDSPKMFPEDQLYISLKMSHGGEDIQNHVFSSARQSYHIILQVICALAVAERSLEFEHRDLHIGNILVSKTKEKSILFKIDGIKFKLPTFNKKATIIDYTLSRINADNQLLYNDLGKDEELFQGQGDLQFQIYRDMREDTRNEWNKFVPKTNLRWIHYLATKCFKDIRYKSGSDFHKSFLKKISALADEVLIFSSCHEFMMNSEKTINYRVD